MLWAALSFRGSSELVFLEGKQNCFRCLSNLEMMTQSFYCMTVLRYTYIKTDKNFAPGEEFEGSEVASSLSRLEPH